MEIDKRQARHIRLLAESIAENERARQLLRKRLERQVLLCGFSIKVLKGLDGESWYLYRPCDCKEFRASTSIDKVIKDMKEYQSY